MSMNLRRLMVTALVVASAAGAGSAYSARHGDAANPPVLHLVLNVPGNRLDVYEKGVRTESYMVSVGLQGYETPQGEYRLRNVIWNPWWHPPDSDWARGRKPAPPGSADNPMGRVKMNFGPLLYIHGTPEGTPMGRPASRGCVRMRNEDVIELAKLVQRHATPGVDRSLLQRLAASPTQTRQFNLERQVRFTATYQVATVEDGFLVIYPDVYNRVGEKLRGQVERTLKENGVDPSRVNREHLERLLGKAPNARVAIALDTLVAASPVNPDGEGR